MRIKGIKIDEDAARILDEINFKPGKSEFVAHETSKGAKIFFDDMAAKYGNLRIDDFIDKIIKDYKGKSSLNESLNINNCMSNLQEKIITTFDGYPIDVDLEDHLDKGGLDIEAYAGKPYGNVLNVKLDIKGISLIVIYFKTIEKNKVIDPYGFNVFIKGTYSEYGYKNPIFDRLLSSRPKEAVMAIAKKHNYKISDEYLYSKAINMYCECDDAESFKESSYEIIDVIEEILEEYNSFAKKRIDKIQKDKASASSEFEELARARRIARANKKASNTTVNQALTREDVIKKINSIENPTIEQLAKILASIE